MNLMDLAIKIGVDDQASSTIDKLTHKVGDGLKAAAKVGIAAVAAIGTATVAYVKSAVDAYAEYEQLAGGAQKIFDEIDYAVIKKDAYEAYRTLGISANEYLRIINDTGATFAATMGDEVGYETAKKGLQAISDYASGTGKSVSELSQKFTLITRSTASYQSIADQFSGILPATSADFLEQAQAAGLLSEEYTKLTEVPVADYQYAVAGMLEYGTAKLGLAGNTAAEAATTISGSIAAMKAAWDNLKTGVAQNSEDMDVLIDDFVESTYSAGTNIIDRVTLTVEGIKSVFSNPEQRQKFVDLGKGLLKQISGGIKAILGIGTEEDPIYWAGQTAQKMVVKLTEIWASTTSGDDMESSGKTLLGRFFDGFTSTDDQGRSFAEIAGYVVGNIVTPIVDFIDATIDFFEWVWEEPALRSGAIFQFKTLFDENVSAEEKKELLESQERVSGEFGEFFDTIGDWIGDFVAGMDRAILGNKEEGIASEYALGAGMVGTEPRATVPSTPDYTHEQWTQIIINMSGGDDTDRAAAERLATMILEILDEREAANG